MSTQMLKKKKKVPSAVSARDLKELHEPGQGHADSQPTTRSARSTEETVGFTGSSELPDVPVSPVAMAAR